MRITVVFGTRPEAIKLAPVVLALRKVQGVCCRICVTGQHREMLDQVLNVFEIRPDADLKIMRQRQALAALTARLVKSIDKELAEHRPDLTIVQGDTSTTLCGALAAFYRRIPVAHVEAGLRTGTLEAPWPEEANRVLTSRIASLHFAPTEANRRNLLREGIPAERVLVTGNTVIDALFMALERMGGKQPAGLEWADPWLDRGRSRPLVLITSHRREGFGEGIRSICKAIAILSAHFPEVEFVFPVHLNPNVRRPVRRILSGRKRTNVHLIEPLPYLPFVYLMSRATVILTDSGGIQEEAPSLGIPVLVLREQTERPEAVEAGTATLVGTGTERLCKEVAPFLMGEKKYPDILRGESPFGDGHAADRIVEGCLAFLGRRDGRD
ncbi:MAG: non-hydrolyzing UDP-N-acetylglucosamine 2-epimerase [Thermoanaerobaculia bacterium]